MIVINIGTPQEFDLETRELLLEAITVDDEAEFDCHANDIVNSWEEELCL